MHKELQEGFASVTAVTIVVSITALLAGGVYAVNKLNKLEKENQQLSEKLADHPEEEIEADTATTSTSTPEQKNDSAGSVQKSTHEEVSEESYTPDSSPSFETQLQADIGAITETEEAAEEPEPEEVEKFPSEPVEDNTTSSEEVTEALVEFDTQYTNQKIIEDGATSTGVFQISINVSAEGGDVLIPMTTTDSAFDESQGELASRGEMDQNIIGFSYMVNGDEFSGTQSSEISCPLKQDDRCKIKDGRTSSVEVEATLDPEESGSYSVTFSEVTYIQNEEVKSYDLNESTGALHLR